MFNSKLKQEVEEIKNEVFGNEYYYVHYPFPIIRKRKSLSERISELEENQKLIMDYLKVKKVVVPRIKEETKLIKK